MLPKQRPLEAFPIEVKGESYFVLRDLEGLLDDQVVIDPLSFLVWSLLATDLSLTDLQSEVSKYAGGVVVPAETLQKIVDLLDQHSLLETERSITRRAEMIKAFAKAPTRPARFAGNGGYAGKAAALNVEIDAYFANEKGSGLPDRKLKSVSPRAIVAPHIDFRRGGTCYTHAYKAIAESAPADTYVILGVAHHSPPSPFVLSTKSYDTPFGTAAADSEFISALMKRSKVNLVEHEFTHRNEHSVEFQAVFLKHAHREAPLRIVPILCGGFEEHCEGASPSSSPLIEETIQALAETIRTCDRRVTIIAGVDFAHVGPKFGDDVKVDDTLVKWMSDEDGKSLKSVIAGDAEGFWNSVMADGNKRHVCGLTATYTMLRLLGGAPGRLKRYDYAPDPAGGIVSFASAVFA